jgi:hypothetical protein
MTAAPTLEMGAGIPRPRAGQPALPLRHGRVPLWPSCGRGRPARSWRNRKGHGHQPVAPSVGTAVRSGSAAGAATRAAGASPWPRCSPARPRAAGARLRAVKRGGQAGWAPNSGTYLKRSSGQDFGEDDTVGHGQDRLCGEAAWRSSRAPRHDGRPPHRTVIRETGA